MTEYTCVDEKYAQKEAWDIAIGVQDVDNVQASKYVTRLSQENITQNCDFETIITLVLEQKNNYFRATHEADVVSTRIAQLLSQKKFFL